MIGFTALSMGIFQYAREKAQREAQAYENAKITLDLITPGATASINGGNAMTLNGESAVALYQANRDLRYMRIFGTSEGAEATVFSEAIPPTPMHYEFYVKKLDPTHLKTYQSITYNPRKDKLSHQFTEGHAYLQVFLPIPAIRNGGGILAIFDTRHLTTIWMEILQRISLIVLIVLLLGTFVGMILAKRIVINLTNVVTDVEELASGQFTIHQQDESVQQDDAKDETGQVARAIRAMSEKLNHLIARIKDNSKSIGKMASNLKQNSHITLEKTEEISQLVADAAHRTSVITNYIENIASEIDQSSQWTFQVTKRAQELSTNLNDIFNDVNGVKKNISDISSNSQEAIEITNKAVRFSQNASQIMAQLGVAAQSIGGITEMIKKIANQTNLLALNATIEAASAGESGKGFAVVANEIKELAGQSASAAENIAAQIESVKSNSDAAISAISDISAIIDETKHAVTEITEAVRSQTTSTDSIYNHVELATTKSKEIVNQLSSVSTSATSVSKDAEVSAREAKEVEGNIATINAAMAISIENTKKANDLAVGLTNIIAELDRVVGVFHLHKSP